MKKTLRYLLCVFLVLFFPLCFGSPRKNYLNTPIHDCIKCLCHSLTACYEREVCAEYTMDKTYWELASSPVVHERDDPRQHSSYFKCMSNENCIVETIFKYTELFKMDCNCDGKFDCKDRLLIHINPGYNCYNKTVTKYRAERYNECMRKTKLLDTFKMSAEEDICK